MYTTVAESAFAVPNVFWAVPGCVPKVIAIPLLKTAKAHVRPDFKQSSQPTASFVLVKLFGGIFIK